MSTTTQEEIVAKAGSAPSAAPAATAAPAAPEVPDELREKAAATRENLLVRARAGLERGMDRLEAARAAGGEAQLGEPTVGTYVAFDLYAFTPIQFGGPAPYRPSKIIAGGEFAVIYAILFVNPRIDVAHGFAVPPTVQLGGRTYRVGMEQINLTDVTDGPDDFRQAVFSSPAPDITLLDFWFFAPNPGPRPRFMEANLAVDILDQGQPYAAFASTIIDADSWQVQANIPLRYLVYPK